MITYSFKAKGKVEQYRKIDEAIRTFQFIRNKAISFWMDNRGVKLFELSRLSAVIAAEFELVSLLNSQARQAATERASFSIQRFYENCKAGIWGKKVTPNSRKEIVPWNTNKQDGSCQKSAEPSISQIKMGSVD
jgi:putative transposase